ncbi:MAG: thioredoxin family protein, partial [Alphaproteobacteria bacterium]|nr:thioredoxin family protein [Alphaproteobacteria bacterium]
MEFLVVVKRDCETCQLVEPVLAAMAEGHTLTVYSQDDPAFPESLGGAQDDQDLATSWRLKVETVPTVIRLDNGEEVGRTVGWDRAEWAQLTGIATLGEDLPAFRPGCGSRTMDPGVPEQLALKYGDLVLEARVIDVDDNDDAAEVAFDRGWTDGLPITSPTDLRIARMLAGTTRSPDEILGAIPPNLIDCTIEKAAINA